MPLGAEHFLIKRDNPRCLGYFQSEHALTVLFPDVAEEKSFQYVRCFFNHFILHPLPCQLDLIPAVSSLTIVFDYHRLVQEFGTDYPNHVLPALQQQLNFLDAGAGKEQGRKLRIPVCYDAVYAPDILHVAELKKMTCEEVVAVHSSVVYRVMMLGFLPGFAYMSEVPERLRVNRRDKPRQLVEPGSVGIAGRQTGIYPLPSPGGWFIIGRTPLQVFYPDRKDSPALFSPGDEIIFYSITPEEYENFPVQDYNPVVA